MRDKVGDTVGDKAGHKAGDKAGDKLRDYVRDELGDKVRDKWVTYFHNSRHKRWRQAGGQREKQGATQSHTVWETSCGRPWGMSSQGSRNPVHTCQRRDEDDTTRCS